MKLIIFLAALFSTKLVLANDLLSALRKLDTIQYSCLDLRDQRSFLQATRIIQNLVSEQKFPVSEQKFPVCYKGRNLEMDSSSVNGISKVTIEIPVQGDAGLEVYAMYGDSYGPRYNEAWAHLSSIVAGAKNSPNLYVGVNPNLQPEKGGVQLVDRSKCISFNPN